MQDERGVSFYMVRTEILIRFVSFLSIFLIIMLWELKAPRRKLKTSRKSRWAANLGITVLNPVVLRIAFPVLAIDAALIADARQWGLLNNLDIPYGFKLLAGVLVLDLTIYLQHVMFHAVPTFWRLHMVHHSDLDCDVTTGLRFHPLEIVLSMVIKLALVVALGAPVISVLIFEVILNGASMFNHGNIKIPVKVDRVLRYLVVTPDMHRVHHSVIIRETNSNFGFNFPWWDRIFGTYKDQPEKGHTAMNIGLAQFRNPRKLTLPHLLILPFVGDVGRQPINRH